MTARSSDAFARARTRTGRGGPVVRAYRASRQAVSPSGRFGDRSGSVLLILVLSMVVLLASVGLAVDIGRGYLQRVRMGRAVDAGALAAARALRRGESAAANEAETVARANGLAEGEDASVALSFGNNERGENTVRLAASQSVATTFMRILGIETMNVSAGATAAVPPVDIVLVLDTSGSLAAQGAWTALQDAAKQFVENFDDNLDQMGLVSFQLSAHDRVQLRHHFKSVVKQEIQAMASAGDTNIGEGLRKARNQLTSGLARSNAAKVVVFFTDGRATAFRGNLGSPAQDRVLAVFTSGNNVRGYFNNPESLPPFTSASPDGCANVSTCFSRNASQIRSQAAAYGATQAHNIRQDGILIYAIGLGNPSASDPLLTPDMDYLRAIANVDGMTDVNQPQGEAYFAPSAAQLKQVFQEVASDLIVRLAR